MSKPAAMHEHALSNLRYIREAMERAGTFTSIPGWGGVAVGISAIVAAAVAHRAETPRAWLATWLIDAAAAAAIAGLSMVRKARRASVSFRDAPARRFFVSYFAPIAAAAALTFVLVRAELYAALPATWLLLYGASFISSGAYSIRVVPAMGVCFMLLGLGACFVSLAAGNVLLGVGFGGLHIVFGLVIAKGHGG